MPVTKLKDLKVEMRAIETIVPYDKNPRRISEAAVIKVAESIKAFGWQQPIVVDAKGVIIIGHARRLAAIRLGHKLVPVVVADLTPDQARALRLADNRTGEEAAWDMKLLTTELTDLVGSGVELLSTGFDGSEVDRLLTAEPSERDRGDHIPPAPSTPVTRSGDVWQLGKHRLMCGDSSKPADVATLARNAKARLLFTSPPYLSQREYKGSSKMPWLDMMTGIFGSHMPLSDDVQILVNLGLVHREGEWLPYWEPWIEAMQAKKWRRFGFYVWDQGPGMVGDWNGRLAPSHEFIFHLNRETRRPRKTKACKNAGEVNFSTQRQPNGTTKPHTGNGQQIQRTKIPDSVIRVTRHQGRDIEVSHPAVFPVALVTEVLTAFSDRGDVVYEPFAGSGTLIIGAERTGRVAIAMECAPEYVDIAVMRYQLLNKRGAILESSGQTFDKVQASRLGKQQPDGSRKKK